MKAIYMTWVEDMDVKIGASSIPDNVKEVWKGIIRLTVQGEPWEHKTPEEEISEAIRYLRNKGKLSRMSHKRVNENEYKWVGMG